MAVPSQLLERRPDIAANERQVAAANANIGIAQTAYYPTLTLSASPGFLATGLAYLFTYGQPLLVRGTGAFRRRCSILAAAEPRCRTPRPPTTPPSPPTGRRFSPRFRKWRTIWPVCATWPKKRCSSRKPWSPPSEALNLEVQRYRAGTDSYLNVITTQIIALGDEQTAVTILQRRMSAAVDLVKALGGGWDASTLPSPNALKSSSLADPRATQNVARTVTK